MVPQSFAGKRKHIIIADWLRLEGTSEGDLVQHPWLEQGHLEQFAQDHVQKAFEYLQGWRLHNLSGQPMLVLGHPHSKKVFPDVRGKLLCFSLCPLTLKTSLRMCFNPLLAKILQPLYTEGWTQPESMNL